MREGRSVRARLTMFLALLCPLLAAAGGPGGGAGPLPPGDHRLSVMHGGRERTFIVHVPPQGGRGTRLAVVLNFHGGGGKAEGQKSYSRMDAVADGEGFLAVYPDGTGRLSDRLLTWNAGTCCGYARDQHVDDVGFIRALLQRLDGLISIDRGRVYATGLSNGAMLAYRLAVEAPDAIAAIAPVAGGMVVEGDLPPRTVPLMHIHSVNDPRALYQGGVGPPFPMTTARVEHPNIDRVIGLWARHDGCPAEPVVAVRLRGREGSPEAGHTATKYIYAPCRDGAEVVLWKLTGAGHVWPGGQRDYLPHLLGSGTQIIDANVEMWRFFSRFSVGGRESAR